MTTHVERRSVVRRDGDQRGAQERRVGRGRRIWNRRISEITVEIEQRSEARRAGVTRREGVIRRAYIRRNGDRRSA